MSYQPPPVPPPPWGAAPPRPPSPQGLVIAIAALAVVGTAVVIGAILIAKGDGSSGGGDRSAYVDALAAIAGESELGDTDTENRCVAEGAVDTFGLELLRSLGTPEAMLADPATSLTDRGLQVSQAQGEQLYQVMERCVGVRVAIGRRIAEGYPDISDCIMDAFSDDFLRRLFIAGQVDGEAYLDVHPDLAEGVEQAITDCD